jgi:hypothetical protein
VFAGGLCAEAADSCENAREVGAGAGQAAAQLKEDVEWRKDVAEKTGLGFALPVSMETSDGQLEQPEVLRSEEPKAA